MSIFEEYGVINFVNLYQQPGDQVIWLVEN